MSTSLRKLGNGNGGVLLTLPELTEEQSSYMLSPNDESITYGDNGGILSPEARLGPENKDALIPTVIAETSNHQVANVLSPEARLNEDVQGQIYEFNIMGVKTNKRSVATIGVILAAIYFAQRYV